MAGYAEVDKQRFEALDLILEAAGSEEGEGCTCVEDQVGHVVDDAVGKAEADIGEQRYRPGQTEEVAEDPLNRRSHRFRSPCRGST